jgi:hypothetical protein
MTTTLNRRKYQVILIIVWLLAQASFAVAKGETPDAFAAMVEADWAAQEQRKNRTLYAPAAVREAFQRAERLIDDLRKMPDGPQLDIESAILKDLRSQAEKVDSLDTAARLTLCLKVRSIARSAALKNPLIASKPIVFMKRRADQPRSAI